VAAIAVLLIGSGAASGAWTRVSEDPCSGNPERHVIHHPHATLHCGKVFEVPGHRTVLVSGEDAPAPCHPGFHIPVEATRILPGEYISQMPEFMHRAKWDFWSQHGAWVLWNGLGEVHPATWPFVQFRPYLHNWLGWPWPVREYFWCTALN
jgi:hypothetical protein